MSAYWVMGGPGYQLIDNDISPHLSPLVAEVGHTMGSKLMARVVRLNITTYHPSIETAKEWCEKWSMS